MGAKEKTKTKNAHAGDKLQVSGWVFFGGKLCFRDVFEGRRAWSWALLGKRGKWQGEFKSTPCRCRGLPCRGKNPGKKADKTKGPLKKKKKNRSVALRGIAIFLPIL
jgi:hypothetical protein